jgi:hypothetical protein
LARGDDVGLAVITALARVYLAYFTMAWLLAPYSKNRKAPGPT